MCQSLHLCCCTAQASRVQQHELRRAPVHAVSGSQNTRLLLPYAAGPTEPARLHALKHSAGSPADFTGFNQQRFFHFWTFPLQAFKEIRGPTESTVVW